MTQLLKAIFKAFDHKNIQYDDAIINVLLSLVGYNAPIVLSQILFIYWWLLRLEFNLTGNHILFTF